MLVQADEEIKKEVLNNLSALPVWLVMTQNRCT